jgi:hypothetical protein
MQNHCRSRTFEEQVSILNTCFCSNGNQTPPHFQKRSGMKRVLKSKQGSITYYGQGKLLFGLFQEVMSGYN